MKRSWFTLAALALLLTGRGQAKAGFVTDRNVFDSSTTGLVTTDFEGLVGTPDYPQNYPFGSGYWTTSQQGITVNGVRYVGGEIGETDTYILGGNVANGAYNINGAFTLVGGRKSTDIYLPTGVRAFGADYGLSDHVSGLMQATVTLKDGTTEVAKLDVRQANQFFGFLENQDISHIQVTPEGGWSSHYLLLDNAAYGDTTNGVTAVPEPSSLALLGLGAAGLLGSAYRRWKLGVVPC